MSNKNRLPQDRLKKPYARVLIPEEDGTYSAELLEFPGCYAQGDTPGQAIQNLEEAAASWIEAALEQGQDIPEPLASHGYSGKINLRLPKSIHKKAARFAQKDDVSLNQFFAGAIAARVGAEEFCDRLVERLEAQLRQPLLSVNLFRGWTTQILSSAIGSIPRSSCVSSDVSKASMEVLDPARWPGVHSIGPATDSIRVTTDG